jgi:putative oxidoreductase
MKKYILGLPQLNTDLAALLLRLIVGVLFVYYGYMKIDSYNVYLPMFKDYIGIGAKLSYNLVIFAEFFCGLLVTIGFLTRLAIIPITITMIVAFFVAHANDAFEVKQLALIFLLLSVVIFVTGSGRYSADRLLFNKKKTV